MWVGELRCPLCDAPMHFPGRPVSSDVLAAGILKVNLRPARFELPAARRQRCIVSWRRTLGWSPSNVPERLICVMLATAVVAALFVAGMTLL
jgi:hypothetical protein